MTERPDIIVEDPPASPMGPRGTDWAWVAEQVRNNAPNWCFIGIFNPSMATHLRNGRTRAVDPHEFEFTVRAAPNEPPTRVRLYMRVAEVT